MRANMAQRDTKGVMCTDKFLTLRLELARLPSVDSSVCILSRGLRRTSKNISATMHQLSARLKHGKLNSRALQLE